MQMMSYGIDNSFSIFSSSMEEDATLGFPSATSVSFGNSVSLGLSPIFGVFAGFLVDRVCPQVMMMLSTCMLFAGLWLGSTVTHSSTQVTFSYSLLASISSAFMLSPGAAATASWFDRRIGIAQGINFCGGGIGSAFIPTLAGRWVEEYGWRHTFRLMSVFCSFGVVASVLSCRRHDPESDDSYTKRYERMQPLHSSENVPHRSSSEKLYHALHTRKLSFREIIHVYLSPEFIANFSMFTIFGWAFYGLIYITVPYVSSMGDADTVYKDLTKISTSKASTIFTFWGTFQIVGSIATGGLGSWTTVPFAYSTCSAIGGIATALLIFCRGYAAFAICLSIVGFCTAGVFAMMPALIARTFYGPNLGLFMASVFVAGSIGGFSAPPMQATLQTNHNGNYSYGCLVISACMTVPGIICYLFLWPEKQIVSFKLFSRLLRRSPPQH